MAISGGNGQAAPFGTVLPNPVRVIVTQGGNPVAGRQVGWSVAPEGGSANPGNSVTGADGIASSVITLPPIGATITITATAPGVANSPIGFTADATGATTQVTVGVGDSFFSPDAFRVKQGGLVTFLWRTGSTGHNVTPVAPNTIPASSNPSSPGTHSAPHTFDVTFPAVGVFKFFCSVHGAPDAGMHGTITVVP